MNSKNIQRKTFTYRKWIVTWNEKDMEDCSGGKISSQQTTCVRKNRLGVDEGQHEERNCPYTMEDLKCINQLLHNLVNTCA